MKSSPAANRYGANSISAMNSSLTQKWSEINKKKRFGGADHMNHTIGGGSVASTGLQRPSTGLNASIGAGETATRPSQGEMQSKLDQIKQRLAQMKSKQN